jgi:hypothetical protein
VSLVGDGTVFIARTGAGVTARVGTGMGEPQGRSDLPGGGLGTGAGEQEAATVGIRVGAGTGVASPLPLGRVAAIGAGDLSTVGGGIVDTAEAEAVGLDVPATVGAAPAQHGTAHHRPVVGGTVYQRPAKPRPSPSRSSLPAVPSATGLPATVPCR